MAHNNPTYILTAKEPATPVFGPSPGIHPSPSFSLKSSFSSLLDSDSESIISNYSPTLHPQPTYSADEARSRFDSDDIFSLEPRFTAKRKTTSTCSPAASSSSNIYPDLPPSLCNSKAFAAALDFRPPNPFAASAEPSGNKRRRTATPRLVMPKVALPAPRPFHPDGLTLGKLKILVAGDSGAGKSNLIRTLAQHTALIVHVDDFASPVESPESSQQEPHQSTSLYDNLDLNPDHQHALTELLASTKPRPQFWANDGRRTSVVEASTSTSSVDATLDRNVCFVDTIGYGSFSSATNCFTPVLAYLEAAFVKTLAAVNPSSEEALSLITSSSSLTDSSLTDVCIYTILNRIKPVDVEYMKKLARYVPIIPVIAKSDLLPPRDVLELKIAVLRELHHHNITPFLFGTSIEEAVLHCELHLAELDAASHSSQQKADVHKSDSTYSIISFDDTDDEGTELELDLTLFPCAVSCAHAPAAADDEMDASVLMAPDYTPALRESELPQLIAHLFSSHGAAWLRYSAAKQFLAWCGERHATFTLHSGLSPAPEAYMPHAIVVREENLALVSNGLTSQSPSPLNANYINDDFTELTINLPDYAMFETRRRAQRDTSKWVNRLSESVHDAVTNDWPGLPATGSSDRPLLSLRTQSRAVYKRPRTSRDTYSSSSSQARPQVRTAARTAARTGRTVQSPLASTSPQRPGPLVFKHSHSVTSLDPLDLWGYTARAAQYTVKAVGVLLGAKLVVWLYYIIVADPLPLSAMTGSDGAAGMGNGSPDNTLIMSPSALLHFMHRMLADLSRVSGGSSSGTSSGPLTELWNSVLANYDNSLVQQLVDSIRLSLL